MKNVYVLLFIFSLYSSWWAPDEYDYSFCFVQMLVALLSSVVFIVYISRDNGFVNFHTFFLFSYFCINYLHAVFVYPDDSLFPVFRQFKYNHDIIPYALAVAQVGLQSYILGVLWVGKRKMHNRSRGYIQSCSNVFVIHALENISLFASFCLFVFVFFVLRNTGGLQHLYPRLMLLLVAIISLSVYLKAAYLAATAHYSVKQLIKLNIKNILAVCLFVFSLLYIGSRGNVLFLMLYILGVVNCCCFRIKLKLLLPCFIVALLLMAIITVTRITSVNFTTTSVVGVLQYGWDEIARSSNALLVVFTDLIVNARNLYDGIEFVKDNGYLFGQSYFSYLFAWLPFGASFFTRLYLGQSPGDLTTSRILTDWHGATYGLGTNMIGDIYMNFSFIGVILMCFFLGNCVRRCELKDSVLCRILYFSFLAFSIYLPRADVFCWSALFMMSILIFVLLNRGRLTIS